MTPQPAPPPVAKVPSLPTADQVARAVVAAARVLQEDPLILGEAVSGAGMCKLSRRYRFAAFAALKAKFEGAPEAAIARMTALPNPSAAVFSLKQAKGSRWWAELGEQAVEAAIAALGQQAD